MSRKVLSIRGRIIVAFGSLAVVIALLFSFYNFLFAYVIEDEFFNRVVKEEASYLVNNYQITGEWVEPRQSFIEIYETVDDLPKDILATYLEEPWRIEFEGQQGRHYHVVKTQTEPSRFVIGEVSDYLMVRPMTKGLLVFFLVTTLVLVIFSCLIAYWIANRSLRPLIALSEKVKLSTPDNIPKHFASQFPQNEVGVLATTLDQAMGRINAFIEREQHFTRDASHELRTPVAIIKGATELLAKEPLSEKDKALITRIENAALQMEQTINSLLALAREEKEATPLSKVKVLPIAEQVVIDNSYLIDEKQIEVEVTIKPTDHLYTTPGVLKILLSNLISNAFQYTSQGKVEVCLRQNTLLVSDSGEGIETGLEQSLFETMNKGSKSAGFGIGLSIVKRLCERYKLRLAIDSGSNGTTVTISFPNQKQDG